MSETRKTGKDTSPHRDDIHFYADTGRVIKAASLEMLTPEERQIVKEANFGLPYQGEPMIFSAIGSSELFDYENDRMMRSMLQDMQKLPANRPVFGNHDYTIPESAFARMLESPQYEVIYLDKATRTAPAGAEVAVVKFMAQFLDNNPRAVQTAGYLDRGLDIAISVGIQITEYEIRLDPKTKAPVGLDIIHGDPLEFSTVGIGCNTESWIQRAKKGLFSKSAQLLPGKEEDAVYMIRNWGDFDGVDALFLYRLNKEILEPAGLTIVRKWANITEAA